MENIIGGSHSIVIPHKLHRFYTGNYNPDVVCKVSADINYELVIARFLDSKTKDKKKCKKYFAYIDTQSIRSLSSNRELVRFICSLPEFLKINRIITDFYYFTMDFAGQDLYEICVQNNSFLFQDEKYFKTMVKQLFKGISFLHGLGVCHFDIKPENITYCPYNKHFKYIDFGYAEMYPFIGYINSGPRGTLDYIPITYNAHDTANMKLDPATPYVKCNDWTAKDQSVYASKYKFHNKLYPELCYKADTYALGKTIYYVYYYYTQNKDNLSASFKMGVEALIFDLINNDINDRPYLCNVAFKKYFKIKKTNLDIAPKFGSREYLYTDKYTIDYGTRLLEAYGSSSTVSTVSTITSASSNDTTNNKFMSVENTSEDSNGSNEGNEGNEGNAINRKQTDFYSDTSDSSDSSDCDSITSLEIQNSSRNCLSNMGFKFSFKKLISLFT